MSRLLQGPDTSFCVLSNRTVLKRSCQQNLCCAEEAFFFLPEGVLDAGVVMQKMCLLRKRSIAGGVSASNFLVTGQCTPDFFFPFEYRSPWCYNFSFSF